MNSGAVNWGRAKKTTLLPLIRLQNKAMRTLEYNKTKTTMLYSKHKNLEMPDIFQLSVAKFMYSFYTGGLPTHFDNYFAEIESIHKYQTRLASLQKYYLPRMKTSLGQLSLIILVRKFGLTFRKNWNHLRLIHLDKNIKSPAILPDFLMIFVLYSCHIL